MRSVLPSQPKAPTQTKPVPRRDPRENTRRLERFLVRAQALFFARIAFLVLGAGVALLPDWRGVVGAKGWLGLAWFILALGYSLANYYVLKKKPKYGQRVTFGTLSLDLILLVVLIANSGGVRSPVMAAQLIFTIFFALLFPSPMALLPPLLGFEPVALAGAGAA